MDHDADPTVPSTERPSGLPDPYTFCNCGRAGCPSIATDPDGNLVISEDLERMTEPSAGRSGVVFQPEQARELFSWLKQHGFGS